MMASMRFTKMHGLGNDYVYINGFEHDVADPAALAVRIADRHFGVGGDGLILVLPPQPGVNADVRMRMFNNDGSEAEMCGNGIRCVCKFAHDRGLTTAHPIRVETGNGVLILNYQTNGDGKVYAVTVDMGEPILEPAAIPVDPSRMRRTDQPQTFELTVGGERYTATCVSMGNPHAVIYIDGTAEDWRTRGRAIERHPAFPNKVNVHFVHVESPERVRVWHWERGTGETLACGTGACAVCVAGVLTGRTQRQLIAALPGGELQLDWDESTHHVKMTGPATEVFTGEWQDV